MTRGLAAQQSSPMSVGGDNDSVPRLNPAYRSLSAAGSGPEDAPRFRSLAGDSSTSVSPPVPPTLRRQHNVFFYRPELNEQ